MNLNSKAVLNAKVVFKMSWNRCGKAIPLYSKNVKSRRNILKFYIQAQLLNLTKSRRYQVDHIIPLTHKLVCGLHSEFNLQVLSKVKNTNKSNYFIPYREINGKKFLYYDMNINPLIPKYKKKFRKRSKTVQKLAKKLIKNRISAKKR